MKPVPPKEEGRWRISQPGKPGWRASIVGELARCAWLKGGGGKINCPEGDIHVKGERGGKGDPDRPGAHQ